MPAEPKTTVIAITDYKQAVHQGRQSIAALLSAPTLFSWFVGLTAIVISLSSILPLRLFEVFQVGQLATWLIPIRLWLLLGGIGLLYTEIRLTQQQWWNITFRAALVIAYFALALLWWQSLDVYGVAIAGLIGSLILLELITEVTTLKSFTIYSFGLLLSLGATALWWPENQSWQSLVTAAPWILSWPGWVLAGAIGAAALLAVRYYFNNKQLLSYLVALTAIPLAGLSLVFAGESDWPKTFILIMSALFIALVPFWDELSFRRPEIRGLVLRMFGALLGIFVVMIVLIYLAQNLLVQNVSETLLDKVTYGKIQTEVVVNNAQAAVNGLSQNPLLISTINQPDNLMSLARNLYESNLNLYKVVIADAQGIVLASYPSGGTIATTDVSGQDYFSQGIINPDGYLSGIIKNFEGSGINVVAMARPIISSTGQTEGLIIGYLDLSLLNDSLSSIANPRTNQYFILQDSQQRWLVWPKSFDIFDAKQGDVFIQELSRSGLVRQGYARDGHLSLAASQSLLKNNWEIAIIVPFFDALSVKQTAYIALLAISGLSILTIGITILSERAKKTNDLATQ